MRAQRSAMLGCRQRPARSLPPQKKTRSCLRRESATMLLQASLTETTEQLRTALEESEDIAALLKKDYDILQADHTKVQTDQYSLSPCCCLPGHVFFLEFFYHNITPSFHDRAGCRRAGKKKKKKKKKKNT